MVKQFLTLYTPERATWTNITELTDDLRWTEMTAQTAAEFFDSHNVLHRFSREVIEAATRVNYGQVCFALLTLLTPKKTLIIGNAYRMLMKYMPSRVKCPLPRTTPSA